MQYTPPSHRARNLLTCALEEARLRNDPCLVRELKVLKGECRDGMLLVQVEPGPTLLSIPQGQVMTFQDESITAEVYFNRIIEIGDRIDCVVPGNRPLDPAAPLPLEMYWIHIVYEGTRSSGGTFRQKEDGDFALRTKSGEKAERVVARHLRFELGHPFPDALCLSPGVFTIRYAGKRERKPDRVCPACGLPFEVKKRNKDRRFRVSHSPDRPFESENTPDGWHAFVFPDMKPKFVSNAEILQAIRARAFTSGQDKYDSWADLHEGSIHVSEPPRCPGAK